MENKTSLKRLKMIVVDAVIGVIAIAIAVGMCVLKSDFITCKGDVLSYAGTILSTIGTIVLSIITVHIAKISNDIAINQQKTEERMREDEKQPFVNLTRVTFEEKTKDEIRMVQDKVLWRLYKDKNKIGEDSADKYGVLWFYLTNSTDYFLTAQYHAYYINDGDKITDKTSESVIEKVNISKAGTDVIGLYASPDFWKNVDHEKFTIELILENRFGDKYHEKIEIMPCVGFTACVPGTEESNRALDMLYRGAKYHIDKEQKDDEK